MSLLHQWGKDGIVKFTNALVKLCKKLGKTCQITFVQFDYIEFKIDEISFKVEYDIVKTELQKYDLTPTEKVQYHVVARREKYIYNVPESPITEKAIGTNHDTYIKALRAVMLTVSIEKVNEIMTDLLNE